MSEQSKAKSPAIGEARTVLSFRRREVHTSATWLVNTDRGRPPYVMRSAAVSPHVQALVGYVGSAVSSTMRLGTKVHESG